MAEDLNFDPLELDLTVPDKPWIGVHIGAANSANVSYVFSEKPLSGPMVLKVVTDGPAHTAGIRAGDMIVQVDHSAVSTPDTFIQFLQKRQVGEVVIIGISRDDHILQLKVQIGCDPKPELVTGSEEI